MTKYVLDENDFEEKEGTFTTKMPKYIGSYHSGKMVVDRFSIEYDIPFIDDTNDTIVWSDEMDNQHISKFPHLTVRELYESYSYYSKIEQMENEEHISKCFDLEANCINHKSDCSEGIISIDNIGFFYGGCTMKPNSYKFTIDYKKSTFFKKIESYKYVGSRGSANSCMRISLKKIPKREDNHQSIMVYIKGFDGNYIHNNKYFQVHVPKMGDKFCTKTPVRINPKSPKPDFLEIMFFAGRKSITPKKFELIFDIS